MNNVFHRTWGEESDCDLIFGTIPVHISWTEEIQRNLSQDSQCHGKDSNQEIQNESKDITAVLNLIDEVYAYDLNNVHDIKYTYLNKPDTPASIRKI